MFKSCDDNACITLTDDDLESALTLKLVLTFVCYGKFDVAWVNTQRSILVCRFLSKYDIQITLQHLQNLLWGVVARREDCCINTFILGATMGDAKLCAMTIRRKGGLCWHKVNDALDCTKNAGGGPANDLGCLSWDNFSSIPLAYTHAFLRACFMNESETGQKKWEGIADDFERLISKHPGIGRYRVVIRDVPLMI